MPRLSKGSSTPPVPLARLTRAQEQFIQVWGQMGPAWGVSRTMAEVHALLYVGAKPLNTDDVMERLRISRGNASMSLRALVEWGLISRVHIRGDRKEYYEADQDAWSMARTVIRERLRREILPLLAALYDIRDQTGEHAPGGEAPMRLKPDELASAEAVATHNQRLDELVSVIQTVDRLGERFVGSEGKGLRLAATLLSKVI
ncbi:MAG TPA: MarR family transcriptional regulator [Phycisphaerales bacterium]|jgi:DNA-binding transcriptional regulator GbsR (MarR family)|nr:MarR family transcriptional regulator [Phycisphaerales bacterium]